MPIPKPRRSEDREDFVSRCMGNETMLAEYDDEEQRAAVCFDIWRRRNEKGKAMGNASAPTAPVFWKENGMRFVAAPLEVKELDERGTFEGLASVYGNVDMGGDVVQPGAFKEMMLTQDGHIRILDGHDTRKPIGKGKLTDTHMGLAIKGKLNLEVARAREVLALMKDGIVDGLSIGYDVMDGGSELLESGVRLLKSLKLWEVSTTAFPMNQQALVSAVKARDVRDVRDLEDLLREAAGLSRTQAKRHASAIWETKLGQRDAGDISPTARSVIDFFTKLRG